MRDYLEAVLDKNLGNGLRKYIEEELFTQIHVLHPLYAVHGKIEQDSIVMQLEFNNMMEDILQNIFLCRHL